MLVNRRSEQNKMIDMMLVVHQLVHYSLKEPVKDLKELQQETSKQPSVKSHSFENTTIPA